MKQFDRRTVLLVIDVQIGFDDPGCGERNNPAAEANVAALLAAWRAVAAPIVHVHHDSGVSGRLRLGMPGHAVKPEAQPLPGEPIYVKDAHSAFIGTELEADLRNHGARTLVVVGLTTNHCISTTVRMAGNLGFEVFVVADAVAAFDGTYVDGRPRLAAEVHDGALSDLQGEFAEIVDTAAVLAAVADRPGRVGTAEGDADARYVETDNPLAPSD